MEYRLHNVGTPKRDGRTDGQSWATTRPAFAIGNNGKNQTTKQKLNMKWSYVTLMPRSLFCSTFKHIVPYQSEHLNDIYSFIWHWRYKSKIRPTHGHTVNINVSPFTSLAVEEYNICLCTFNYLKRLTNVLYWLHINILQYTLKM